jgi:hypothetical protein
MLRGAPDGQARDPDRTDRVAAWKGGERERAGSPKIPRQRDRRECRSRSRTAFGCVPAPPPPRAGPAGRRTADPDSADEPRVGGAERDAAMLAAPRVVPLVRDDASGRRGHVRNTKNGAPAGRPVSFEHCFTTTCESGRPDSNRRRPAWEAGILPTELRPQALPQYCRGTPSPQEPPVRIELTTARLRIGCSTTELRWRGSSRCTAVDAVCPGADSNRDAFRHHPLKMACLPVSPPGHPVLHLHLHVVLERD